LTCQFSEGIVRVFFENLMIVVLQKPYQDTSVFKHNRDL